MKYATPLKFGFLAGVAGITLQALLYFIAPAKVSTNMWMMAVYVPVLFFMIFGGITFRKEAGQINYAKGLAAVFIIAITGAAMVNIFTYELLMGVIDPDLIPLIKEEAKRSVEEMAEKRNLDYDTMQASLQQVENVTLNVLRAIAWGVSGFFSVILSLVVAAFVSRPEQTTVPKAE